MFSAIECYRKAAKKINELFGTEYLVANRDDVILARTDWGDVCEFFVGIKTIEQRPYMKAEKHGWTVWAHTYIDKETGYVKLESYQLDENPLLRDNRAQTNLYNRK